MVVRSITGRSTKTKHFQDGEIDSNEEEASNGEYLLSSRKTVRDLIEDEDEIFDNTEIDQRLIGRNSKGKNVKRWMIYPEDQIRTSWDFLATS